jgi:hypothetical protein
MYGEARGYLLDAFNEVGEKGLYLYEIYKLLEGYGITDKPANRRVGNKVLNELYDMGLVKYGVIPSVNESELENPLDPPCNFYSIGAARKREPLRPGVVCLNPY